MIKIILHRIISVVWLTDFLSEIWDLINPWWWVMHLILSMKRQEIILSCLVWSLHWWLLTSCSSTRGEGMRGCLSGIMAFIFRRCSPLTAWVTQIEPASWMFLPNCAKSRVYLLTYVDLLEKLNFSFDCKCDLCAKIQLFRWILKKYFFFRGYYFFLRRLSCWVSDKKLKLAKNKPIKFFWI